NFRRPHARRRGLPLLWWGGEASATVGSRDRRAPVRRSVAGPGCRGGAGGGCLQEGPPGGPAAQRARVRAYGAELRALHGGTRQPVRGGGRGARGLGCVLPAGVAGRGLAA